MHQILKLYENRLWLKHQYTDLQKSAYKIARECGIKVGVVYTWLRRFNIPIRSCSKAAQLRAGHVNLTKEILEFLNGGLLGDGHMQKGYSVSYSQSSKYESYVKWLSEKFIEFGIKQTGKIGKMVGTSRKGKKLTNFDTALDFPPGYLKGLRIIVITCESYLTFRYFSDNIFKTLVPVFNGIEAKE